MLTSRQKTLLKLGIATEFGQKGDKELLLLKEIQRIEDELANLKQLAKGDKGDKGDTGAPGKDGRNGLDGKNGTNGIDGKDGRNGLNGINGTDGLNGINGIDGSPDTAEMIVEKLNLLDEAVEVKTIKGLQKQLDELNKRINSKSVPMSGGNAGGGGRIVKSFDISSSLNGVSKTFSLPAFWRVISVHLSSVPNVLRETVDYTTNASLMKITFTSEINASTSLASGQTCIIIYGEA